ncbi:MAG: PD-(D/E)XK nuclease family protein [Anaerovoracaceae bacterium]|jgi:ATP-dependent helicase/nuclease subunit B
MLNVYYGSADFDLERFMFEKAAERMPEPVIVMVPDQFTLQAERDALRIMRADTLLNLEVMSRSGFTRKILGTAGSPAGVPITKYGRYMLLSGIIRKSGSDGVFSEYIRGSRAVRTSFSEMLNDEISELKQYGVSPGEMRVMSERFGDSVLGKKLSQTADIYQAYQEKTAGRYNDNDDLQRAAAQRMAKFGRIKDTVLWVYGFEYMAPAMLELIIAAAENAPEVNIVFTGEKENKPEFDMFRRMSGAVGSLCAERSVEFGEHHVPERYLDKREPRVSVIAAGDYYSEAETTASIIAGLVRDRGLRYRDIAVICNDMEVRGPLTARIFSRYGIPVFFDSRRSVMQEPAAEFICALIDCAADGRQFDDVFRMLKTGFGPIDDADCSRLEMYCRRYRIKSGRWKKEFKYGIDEEGAEGLAEINRMRREVSDFITSFEELFKDKATVKEKTEALYIFLRDRAGMPDKIQRASEDLENRGLHESAESLLQMWKIIIGIMDQMVEASGDEELDAGEYSEMFREGLSQVEIGLIPATGDNVILGNMQRTRTGDIKALFVIGANDGVLPEEGKSEGIFSDLEKRAIEENFRPVGRTDAARNMEQDLDIYKNTSRARELLVISYASQDLSGSEIRPSTFVADIIEKYGSDVVHADFISAGDPLRLIQTPGGTAPHLASSLRKAADSGIEPDDAWKAASLVMTGTRSYEAIRDGIFFSKASERLRSRTVGELYGTEGGKYITLSASRIENFSRCPFSFFVRYGLNPSENREFDVDSRSVGDMFHYCFMRAAKDLSAHGMPEAEPGKSLWLSVSEEDVRSAVERYVDEYSETYREGVFGYSDYGRYIRERIKDVIFINVWIMIIQVRRGRIKNVFFEKEFRRGSRSAFPAVALTLDNGRTVCLEGKIDRIDEIVPETDDGYRYVRVVDYKTGSDKFNLAEVKDGVMLQLMIYLKGAMGGIKNARPAGVFYFPAHEQLIDITDQPDASEEDIAYSTVKNSGLDGIINGGHGVIRAMDSMLGEGDESFVIPVRRGNDKDGHETYKASSKGRGRVLSSEEFDRLISDVDEILSHAASELTEGSVAADPKVSGNFDACRYCGYKSICGIELSGRQTF